MPTDNGEPTKWLTLELAENLCHRIAEGLADDPDEPMPAFATADRGRLESSLHAPQQSFGSYEPYPGLEQKAAVLLYRLVKNHPFPNGNKRFGTAAYLVFLAINGWWPVVSKDELVALVEEVAASPAAEHRAVVQRVATFTQERLVPIEDVGA